MGKCNHGPNCLSKYDYVNAHEEAERMIREGHKQTKCPKCGLYVWDCDWHQPPRVGRTGE